jgi:hypothetical protein
MPKERGRVPPPKEAEPQTYTLAVRYPDEPSSARSYNEAQAFLYSHEELGLSTFRLQLNLRRLDVLDWHVVVLGDPQPPEVDSQFRRILSEGEEVTLPEQAVKMLMRRRMAASRFGDWVERHHRPGKRRRLG